PAALPAPSASLATTLTSRGAAFSRLPLKLSTIRITATFPADRKWARQDSNLHATGYEPAALAVELRARIAHTLPRRVASSHRHLHTARRAHTRSAARRLVPRFRR